VEVISPAEEVGAFLRERVFEGDISTQGNIMASQQDDTVSTLNNLAALAKDGVNGMNSAAESASNPSLKTTLRRLAQERNSVFTELQGAVRQLGGDPADSGTTAGAAHRGWMNIKSMVAGTDDKTLLDECERGEDVAVKAFQKASSQPLSGVGAEIVRRSYEQVRKSHDEIKSLRNSA
jgi:uncharacterized protein (TIGR02284 family)